MSSSWRLARSLITLRQEIDRAYPGRSKVSDGTIGDLNHQNRNSDHNPWVPPPRGGVVTAADFTDHENRLTVDVTERLRISRDSRIKYVIGERKMFSSYPTSRYPAWVWRPYSGINAHTSHFHISVQPHGYDDDRTWGLFSFNEEENDVVSIDTHGGSENGEVKIWQRRLNQVESMDGRLSIDGFFGPRTEEAVRKFQRSIGVEQSGIINLTTAVQLQAQAHTAANH